MVLPSIMMTTNLIFTSDKGENLYWHIQIRVQILLECLPSFYNTVVIVIFKETGCTFVLKKFPHVTDRYCVIGSSVSL